MIKISFWENVDENAPDFTFLPLDNFGASVIFSVPDWEDIRDYTFTGNDGKEFTAKYLMTSEGLLRLDNKRLLSQIKKLHGRKGKMKIQRWCEGGDSRSTVYLVEKFTPTKQTKIDP